MERNQKRLRLLSTFLSMTLVLIGCSMLFQGYHAYHQVSLFNERFEGKELSGLQVTVLMLTYFNILKTVAVRLLYGFLLWRMRQVVLGILSGETFKEEDAKIIRKTAIYIIWMAVILVGLLLVFTVASIVKGNVNSVKTIIGGLITIFERYVLTALIAFGIAEIFNVGMKLQNEQKLTI